MMRNVSRFKPALKPETAPIRLSHRPRRLTLNQDDQRLLRRQFFQETSRGERTSMETLTMIFSRLQAKPIPGAVMLVQIDPLVSLSKSLTEARKSAICGQISSVISDILKGFPSSLVEDVTVGRVGIVVSSGPGSVLAEADLRRVAEALCNTARVCHQITLTVGVGTIAYETGELARSYQEARDALSYQLFVGNDRYITWNDVHAQHERSREAINSEPFPVQKERKLRERIIAGDKEGALQSLDMMLDSLRNRPELTPASFKSHVLQMVVVLCRSATRIGADVITLTESSLQYAETIMNTDSYPALRAFLRGLVEELIVAALGRSRTPKSEIILLAKKYIAENYVKSPSLREVANFVNLSPHYFSRLFAKENDCGFQDYLNRVRIEAAKDLLRNSPVKVKQAAGRVGFKDVSHFVRLFRRVEGITPAEFTRSVGQVKI